MKESIFGKGKEILKAKYQDPDTGKFISEEEAKKRDIEPIEVIEWDWENFKTTEEFPISENLLDWVIGQDRAILECKLCIDEWINKLKWLTKKKWWEAFENPEGYKASAKELPPAGPFLFMAGDAGTGKSLIGRALANHMTKLYKKHEIPLHDVLAWANPIVPSEPMITIHKAGEGKKVLYGNKIKGKRKSWLKRWGLRVICAGISITGMVIFGIALYGISEFMSHGMSLPSAVVYNAPLLGVGGGMITGGIMAFYFSRILGMANTKGIGGASSSIIPKLLIDNSLQVAPFIDATGHTSAQLFGDISWDPYQSGGLGTPEHQRVNAGDVHRAHMGILFIDEIKNLVGPEATTLLSVLEDGQMSITHRGRHGETGAMMVATEPVPCMTFLVAAGNFDSLPQIHFALMDRIHGYGKVVRMNNEMDNTVQNRRKYVQFISQEISRFHLIPFSREACKEIIIEGRRKTGLKDKLATKFRPLISVLKTASILAMNEQKSIVERKHVIEAINEHCKSIHRQLLEYNVKRQNTYRYINPTAKPQQGQIHALYVVGCHDVNVGSVGVIKASMIKHTTKKGYFRVTGILRKNIWIGDSIAKVRHIIEAKFGIDPAIGYSTMIDFQQQYNIDGPSAGVTMTLVLASIISKKKIRQDVAVTGEINIGSNGEIIITPIGGADQKIRAAIEWGFKKIILPKRNLAISIKPSDYKGIEIIGAETLEEYMRELFVDYN